MNVCMYLCMYVCERACVRERPCARVPHPRGLGLPAGLVGGGSLHQVCEQMMLKRSGPKGLTALCLFCRSLARAAPLRVCIPVHTQLHLHHIVASFAQDHDHPGALRLRLERRSHRLQGLRCPARAGKGAGGRRCDPRIRRERLHRDQAIPDLQPLVARCWTALCSGRAGHIADRSGALPNKRPQAAARPGTRGAHRGSWR